MPSFNLVDKPWIPCIKDGQAIDVSLREVLVQAHNIKEITDNSPLVTVALHRLLLAILHRVFGPSSFEQWKDLWRQRQWNEGSLNSYFDKWRHRFDLFDKERPFYQTAEMREEELDKHPISLLAHEAATGNNATLFDHSFLEDGTTFTPAVAARYLIARQAFSIGGGVSKPFNLSHAPLVSGYTVLILADNLFETLALNLLPYDEQRPISQTTENGRSLDLPVWEQETLQKPDKNGSIPYGYLDYLTWQSRRLLILGNELGAKYCLQQQNLKVKDHIQDPFKCYKKDKQKGFVVKIISERKALWRDSHSLFEGASTAETKRPKVFDHLAQVEKARRNQEIEASPSYSFVITGMANDQASISLWSREVLPLPLAYLMEKELISTLKQAVQLTEDIKNALKQAIKKLAIELVGKNDAANFGNSLNAEDIYWSSLNYPFKKLLVDLASDRVYDEEEEVTEFGKHELPNWAKLVEWQVRQAFQKAVNSLRTTARELKAASLAEMELNLQIAKVKKSHPNLFPKGED